MVHDGARQSKRSLNGVAAAFFASVFVLWLCVLGVIIATAPPLSEGRVAVVFAPGTSQQASFAALTRARANPISPGWLNWVWAADMGEASVATLKANGAVMVVRQFPFVVLLGCAGAPVAFPR